MPRYDDYDDFDDYDDRPRRRRPRKKGGSNKLLLILLVVGGVVALGFCGGVVGLWFWATSPTEFPEQTEDYADARKGFQTKLTRTGGSPQPWVAEAVPPEVEAVTYTSSGGLKLKAWTDAAPRGGGAAKRPAVLFLHGGFAFGADDWDQAKPYRDAGFVVMVPILRGENGQPGNFTLFYDEVDDAVAAGELLAKRPGVDPNRVYVAGHSAGGTLAMLAAMASKRFKAAASFSGSPDQKSFCRFQPEYEVFDTSDPREYAMRSPLAFPKSFKCPARLYVGSEEVPYLKAARRLAEKAAAAGSDVQAVEVPGDHFTAVPEEMRQSIVFFQGK